MAGQLCWGVAIKSSDKRDTKAYCEGMAYRASDTALNAPITDNPHEAGSSAAVGWDAGWDIADGAAGSTISNLEAGCCAMRGAAVSA